MEIVKKMCSGSERVVAVVRPSAFTTHYTVHTGTSLEIRTVHTCPRCGLRRLIIWDDDNSMLFADLLFGFRKAKYGVVHVQSYCRSCRSLYSRTFTNEDARKLLHHTIMECGKNG